MIQGYSSIIQALLGTLFTWGLTAAGSSLVFLFKSEQRKLLDGSLGFAAGVMLAASYWSLLEPAIDISRNTYDGILLSLFPVVFGFLVGAIFVYGVDLFLPQANNSAIEEALRRNSKKESTENNRIERSENPALRKRVNHSVEKHLASIDFLDSRSDESKDKSWRRILLLVIAITVHNIPEGLAVGVGFGAVEKSNSTTFESARSLAIGIGLQNFPEGLAVSLPLRGCGLPLWQCFWWGQLSGLVEPLAGLVGAYAIQMIEPLLPYALAFAAGAMIFVVVQDILPEAHSSGNSRLTSWCFIVGFLLMMSLDVGLG